MPWEIDRKRATSNGVHHLARGAQPDLEFTHDLDPKIKNVFVVQGFGNLELLLSRSPSGSYAFERERLTGRELYKGELPDGETVETMGATAVLQYVLQMEGLNMANAARSTSSSNNPQWSGNFYKDKESA